MFNENCSLKTIYFSKQKNMQLNYLLLEIPVENQIYYIEAKK